MSCSQCENPKLKGLHTCMSRVTIEQLKDMIRRLIDTSGVWHTSRNGPDGMVCTWCLELDDHKPSCLRHEAANLIGQQE